MMRFCPGCQTERAVDELICEGAVGQDECGWDLSSVPVRAAGWRPAEPAVAAAHHPQRCLNDHPVGEGDLLCETCGADIASATSERAVNVAPTAEPVDLDRTPTVVEGWRLERLLSDGAVRERYIARREDDDLQAVLTLYAIGHEPDPEVYDVLRILDRDHVPEILQVGHWQERAFEVTEDLRGGTLADLGLLKDDVATLSRVLEEVGGALHALAERGLRHRDIRPGAILVRAREPLDLVITSFGSARLSEFDLDIVSPLETTRYMAPEAIAGGVAAASDWWSLGMVLLEQVTRGACFEGVNDQAFLIQVLTNGAPIPEGLDPNIDLLLRGLLARDRHERWAWPQVRQWLDGAPPEAPAGAAGTGETKTRRAINLAGRPYTSPTSLALAAAQAQAWDEARALLLGGGLVTWAQDADLDARLQAELRKLSQMEEVSEDLRLGLALKALNPAMPLTARGEIITPGWLLDHPDEGYALIAGPVPQLLRDKDAEPWLYRLKVRADTVRERARQLDLALNEHEVQVHLLSTSRARLAAVWADRRRLLPDTDHPGLIAILERRQTTDEDYILLLSADVGQFRSAETILAEAADIAARAGVPDFDPDQARAWLEEPRRAIYAEIEHRLEGFARSGIERIDAWADQFRLERRLPIGRALALLGLPRDIWKEPPKQAYVATLLDFFAKRITGAVMRGPLTRMVIGKTTARLDLAELGSDRKPAATLLDHLLLRNEQPFDLDPDVLTKDPKVERRIRTLYSHATLYRRDTGIDGLYLGFPFLVMQEAKPNVKPRIAPILLWPVKLKPEVGSRGKVSVAFDRDREEVRLNPAFETLLGTDAARRWSDLANEMLGRASLNAAEVVDAFSDLAFEVQGRVLTALPNKDVKVVAGKDRIVCAGALFHLAYIGQAVMEDLRQLKAIPPAGSALETAFRTGEAPERATSIAPPELERFFTAASDPSQEMAVLDARSGAGLLIEGPPGTGKSQTIVNMVADAIGRRRSLLIVCQKQSALEVVHKRLVAEGLRDRIVMINDVNKDRKTVIQAVREQVEALLSQPIGSSLWRQQRQQTAARIEALEGELNAHHAAMHADDEATGLSYRLMLGDLIGLDAPARSAIAAPNLRALVGAMDVGQVATLQEVCGPLARLWLPAAYEGSALSAAKAFSPDEGSLEAFAGDFAAFVRCEHERLAVLERTPNALAMDDPAPFRAWIQDHVASLSALSDDERERLKRWTPRLRQGEAGRASELADQLDTVIQAFGDLAPRPVVEAVAQVAVVLGDHELAELLDTVEDLARPVGFLARLSPTRWAKTARLRKFFKTHQLDPKLDLGETLRAEKALRPPRRRLDEARKALHEPELTLDLLKVADLASLARTLRDQLRAALEQADRLARHPLSGQAFDMAAQGERAALAAFLGQHEQAYSRYEARGLSLGALAQLEPWFNDEWRGARQVAILADEANTPAVVAISNAAPTLAAYQRFRPRAALLSPEAVATFAVLRGVSAALAKLPEVELDDEVRRTIERESRLAWKARLEAKHPALLLETAELQAKARALAEADRQMRRLNRSLLIEDIDRGRLASSKAWQDVTRLSGPRTKRLREFVDQGADLGLMSLRPIWLMNPDVASRVLPLKKKLFDTVIYDEASQMPIEYALPSLYRSGQMIVSGDEKQMPPTNFFSSKIENDEAEIFEGDDRDDETDEAVREEVAETWNRREIKDCPDLLQLAKTVLPSTTLQIHYRSAYRELIQFSNAAFYANRLSVPARHPDAEIRRVRPIAMVRADGLYENQTNETEALKVADILAKTWKRPAEKRQSIGVVTFNRKQADLIEEILESRAERDPAFRAALTQERDRVEDGEDMGFFVKNVENVQGDERDVIIFSTTFGRNAQGAFRRAFGVLGQVGGERRLNVAVTRARETVVLVTSMPIAEISDFLSTRRQAASPRDYLQAYFEYARAMSAGELDNARSLLMRLVADQPEDRRWSAVLQDGFQSAVAAYVASLGWTAHSVADTGAFGLDLAIENPATGLYGIGIECDAPRHTLLANARAREMWRPQVLGRSIGRVYRVSSQGWLQAPEAEKARLREAIAAALNQGQAA